MRNWLRRWLGMERLEKQFLSLMVNMGRLSPQQAEELVSMELKKDYKLENDHGEDGQL